MRSSYPWLIAAAFSAALGASAQTPTAAPAAVPERINRASPVLNLVDTIDHPLRYQPVDGDFVIENGPEFFNRPIYGNNTAFRFDGGDKPEFSLYLYKSGHGGNLRFGFATAAGSKWCNDAARVVARYRAGSLLYEISDPLLGPATLNLSVLALAGSEGLVARAEISGNTSPVTLLWAFGGADGARGTRDGDIGTERQPVSQLFQFQPAKARNDTITLNDTSFTLQGRSATISGLASPGTQLALADANQWNSPADLIASASQHPPLSVVLGQIPLQPAQPVFVALQHQTSASDTTVELPVYVEAGGQAPNPPSPPNTQPSPVSPTASNSKLETRNAELSPPAFTVANLPAIFASAESHRRALAEKVTVDTPDPFINAAVPALCVAADAIWDQSAGAYMHGAVAWRSKLLGWRGPYVADALGWHDRAASHLAYWAGQQDTDPIPDVIPPPDSSANLSRSESAVHSNGDLSPKSHYDMNLVYIDALFRHIFETGDLVFARQVWPVIQAHLAWEKRLFRRTYGPGNLPLYEAYAAIWASDDLEYDGGGATHTTAYNYYHNLLAARLARLLGEDPAPYQREAALILQAMHQELWLSNFGWFAENKDLLGLQLAHPNPAVWTFYHTVDSHAATPFEAWQMSRYVDTQIARIPIQGPGVPEGYFTLPTTNWMPYTWSLNNVVMAEDAHTSLAYWQTGRDETAFRLFKGCLLTSMFLGLSPGNAGAMTIYDMARGESQRDFGDAIGITSRALVEGLFGVTPDAVAGEVLLHPGFPADWDHAAIHHPDFSFSYRRGPVVVNHGDLATLEKKATTRNAAVVSHQDIATQSLTETYSFDSQYPIAMGIRLQAVARRDQISNLTVNGQLGSWRIVEDAIGQPRVEISAKGADHYDIVITWQGDPPATVSVPPVVAFGGELRADVAPAHLLQVSDPQNTLNRLDASPSTLNAIAVGELGHRTAFLQVAQGQLRWWLPVPFEIRPAWEILPDPAQDAASLRFRVRNNTATAFDHPVSILAGGSVTQAHLAAPAFGDSAEISLPANGLLPGTNVVTINLGGNQSVTGAVTNWHLPANAATAWTPVNLTALFNDRVTQIFKHEYLSPRSPYASLSIPKQGIGTWAQPTLTADINDSGLRAAAGDNGGQFVLPNGIPFATPGPGTTPNIAFVSQWDNFPRSVDVPLSGHASHAYLLMAGSTNPMQSQLDNGDVVVTYADGSTDRLALRNPTTWWPIEQDYFIDDFAFRRPEALPPRVSLKSGLVRILDLAEFEGRGGKIPGGGGAATVLDLPLDPQKTLKSLTVRAIANDVVIGLMSVTLAKAP